ncbi:hypothetical protein E5D57_012857 [Metarhizium anisopliae]|uniref:Zinc finger protein n=1 Tax=Metarhizium guizhouense (strain ARSEF 977) TaxID=1276136 RepID=A0A0B4GFZ6_METGA|nr:hypothetical protein E5D57_012857 [Metarhizium anisopliae]KID85955.1 zinc finger protein [Metarhizium guizhouense ARSEF 977]
MAPYVKPTSREDFRIAIICALPCEADAVTLLFDEFWDNDGDTFGRARGDTNTYITGHLGSHNVVLAIPPAMGTTNATATAACLRSSFPRLKLTLIIGVCGGVPKINGSDVFLGDVVISKTIVQYDYGRQYPGHFAVKKTIDDSLGRANKDIRGLLASVETEFGHERLQGKAVVYLKSLQETAIRKRRRAKYHYPGMTGDKLFLPNYRHLHQKSCDTCRDRSTHICEPATKASCEDLDCNDAYLVKRERLNAGSSPDPVIFIGCLGSGNTVMKSGKDRDRISAEHGIIAFEMEGAGVWDEMPCIVIKGICDYSDSHKNKAWQDYAAATAAAAARALLERYTREDGDAAAGGSRRKLSQENDSTTTTEARSQPSVKFGDQNSGFQAGTINGSVSGLTFGGQ